MINVTKIKNGCNCYIVENGTNSILIDAGINAGADKIIRACKEKNVKLLLLTHGHMDHIQCAAKIIKELQIPVFMHEKDLGLIADNLSQPMNGRTLRGKVVAFFSKLSAKSGSIQTFEILEPITGDTTIQESGMNIEIMELPGHTKGSIGIKIENHFFVGDALMHMGKADISLLYENMDDLQKSARKIGDVKDTMIYFGHGEPITNRSWI